MPNKVYQAPETTITWADTGGDELLDLGGLAADGVAMGSYFDMGAGSKAQEVEWEIHISGFDAQPVIGETINLFVSQSNVASAFDGAPSADPTDTVQGSMTTDQKANLGAPAGIVQATSTSCGDNLQARFKGIITGRYVSPVIHNDTADILQSASDTHTIKMTRIPPEIQ